MLSLQLIILVLISLSVKTLLASSENIDELRNMMKNYAKEMKSKERENKEILETFIKDIRQGYYDRVAKEAAERKEKEVPRCRVRCNLRSRRG